MLTGTEADLDEFFTWVDAGKPADGVRTGPEVDETPDRSTSMHEWLEMMAKEHACNSKGRQSEIYALGGEGKSPISLGIIVRIPPYQTWNILEDNLSNLIVWKSPLSSSSPPQVNANSCNLFENRHLNFLKIAPTKVCESKKSGSRPREKFAQIKCDLGGGWENCWGKSLASCTITSRRPPGPYIALSPQMFPLLKTKGRAS